MPLHYFIDASDTGPAESEDASEVEEAREPASDIKRVHLDSENGNIGSLRFNNEARTSDRLLSMPYWTKQ